RGVGGDAGEGDPQQATAEPHLVGAVIAVAVDHDGRVEAVEGAAASHDLLAGVPFLGRRAQQHDGAGHGVRVGLIEGVQGEEGADSCGGDDVVSAGVADLGQGVVFGQNGDGAAVAGAGGRSQSGLDSVQSGVDVDA